MADTLYFTGQINDSLSFTGDGTADQIIATGQVAAAGPQGGQGIQGVQGNPGLTVSVNSVTQVAGNISIDTDDIPEGTNKYVSASQLSDISSNTSARHSHANKALLDTYTQTESDLADAVAKKHTPVDISGKQDTLVSGTNIKTINGSPILGSGDMTISGGGGGGGTWGSITGTLSSQTDLNSALTGKEDVANKSTTTTLGTSDTLYPSQKAVKTYVDTTTGNYVAKSGDTMTGNLTVQGAFTANTTSTILARTYITSAQPIPLIVTNIANSSGGGGSGIVSLNDDGAAISVNDRLGYFLIGGSTDGSGTTFNSAGMIATATENWSGSTAGTQLDFATTLNGTQSRITNARLADDGTFFTRNLTSFYNNTHTLGTSSRYWSNLYAQRQYLNSTAYLDGGTAGTANLTGNLGILATSGAATHSLTLGSTSTGIALYNTSDQITNYERLQIDWSGNVARLFAFNGGTGTRRAIFVGSGPSLGMTVQSAGGASASSSKIFTDGGTTTSGYISSSIATLNASSGTQYHHTLAPTINQTSTAGYTALLINPTETTTGSGAKLLIDAQVGGTSKFKVASTGDAEITTSSAGVILKSPNGSRWRVTVDNTGALNTTSI